MLAANNAAYDSAPLFDGEAFVDAKDYEDFLKTSDFVTVDRRNREKDIEDMRVVTGRIRQQVRHIIEAVRFWRTRHAEIDSRLKIRYSSYEGALCYTDLRRHWLYYRHAMKELNSMKQ